MQPDGKIVLGGYATDGNGNPAFLVARLGTLGLPDPSFGAGGKVLVQLGAVPPPDQRVSSWVGALAIQPDGKILAGGYATRPDGAGFLVARLATDGSFDPSFGEGGTAALPARDVPGGPTEPGAVSAITLQPDGKIVTGGHLYFSFFAGAAQVTRLTSGGSPDASFGDNGIVLLFRSNTRHGSWGGSAVAVQPDGRILLAGVGADPYDNTRGAALMVRLNSTGSLDSTFGDDGMVFYQPLSPDDPGRDAVANAMALQPDGKIVIGGLAWNGLGEMHGILVARLSGEDGSLDPSFANGGALLAQIGSAGAYAAVQTLALQPDRKIVLGGWANDRDGTPQLMVARLRPDGSFDPAFGSGGLVLKQLAGGGSQVNALALQPDANIVTAGIAGSESMIARLLGQPPPSPTPPSTTPAAPAVTPPSPPALTPAVAALSQLRISPSAFRAADGGGSIARSTGTTISYRDTQAATTTFTVLKPARGVRRGSRCLKPSRGRHGKRCTRYVTLGSFKHHDQAGANSFHFTGRINHHKLRPGRYRLQAVPRLAGRNGDPTSTSFRIVQ